MWKDHSADYIRQTKSSAVSVVVAAFISALFLSLLCSLAYNFWTYETEQIVIEEGDWQGRISGNLKEDDLIQLKNFANVEKVMVNENLSDGEFLTVDILLSQYANRLRRYVPDCRTAASGSGDCVLS